MKSGPAIPKQQRLSSMPDIASKTTEDIAQDHVDAHPGSNTRRQIFAGYQNYCKDFSEQITGTFTQWIGGSFVTSKIDPGDIDLVNLIAGHQIATEEQAKPLLPFLNENGSKEKYSVDGYWAPVFPEGHKHRNVTEEALNYWWTWFGRSREGHDRTIVQNDFPQPEVTDEKA